MQWSYRVESSLRLYQISFKNLLHGSHLHKRITILAFLDIHDVFFEVILGFYWCQQLPWHMLSSNFKTILFSKKKNSPLTISWEIASEIITMSWVWLIFRQPCQWEFVDVWKHSVNSEVPVIYNHEIQVRYQLYVQCKSAISMKYKWDISVKNKLDITNISIRYKLDIVWGTTQISSCGTIQISSCGTSQIPACGKSETVHGPTWGTARRCPRPSSWRRSAAASCPWTR